MLPELRVIIGALAALLLILWGITGLVDRIQARRWARRELHQRRERWALVRRLQLAQRRAGADRPP